MKAEDFPSNQSAEMLYLKEWVTAGDATRYDNQAQGTLRMDVTHSNLVQRWHDIIFDDDMTVDQVKEKLYRHGGTPAKHQELYLRRGGGDTIFLMEGHRSLKYYGAKNGLEIHIKDTDEFSISKHGGLEDVSQVEKYVMDDESYDKLENTVRAQKKKEQDQRRREAAAQQSEPATLAGLEAAEDAERVHFAKICAEYTLGSRCEVSPGARRGEVAYCGKVNGAKAIWIGVRLDEPQGQNDGTKGGVKYFDCPGAGYGSFAQPEFVAVGDFPPIDPFASDDDEF